jgi:hypothetical protein
MVALDLFQRLMPVCVLAGPDPGFQVPRRKPLFAKLESNAGAANFMPDVIAKTTYDTDLSGRHFHAELTGFVTGAHASVLPRGSASFNSHFAVGGGGQIAMNYELVPNKLVVLANAFLERRWCSLLGRNGTGTRRSP